MKVKMIKRKIRNNTCTIIVKEEILDRKGEIIGEKEELSQEFEEIKKLQRKN